MSVQKFSHIFLLIFLRFLDDQITIDNKSLEKTYSEYLPNFKGKKIKKKKEEKNCQK